MRLKKIYPLLASTLLILSCSDNEVNNIEGVMKNNNKETIEKESKNLSRQTSQASSPVKWIANYSVAQGWEVSKNPRLMADVNGDGKSDIIGFADSGTYVSLSTGNSFSSATLWISEFSIGQGWKEDSNPRLSGDVNGDGKDDIIGFGDSGTYVSLSNGSNFGTPKLWIHGYSLAQGWRVNKNPRIIGDVNGDGKDDIIGFGDSGTYVSLSNGSNFETPRLWISNYSVAQGWRIESNERIIEDVNGDGKDDIIGFADNGTYVSLSTGSGFSSATLWISEFSIGQGWLIWKRIKKPFIDLDGDNRDDHTGKVQEYEYRGNPRRVADIDGDGKADVIGFGDNATYASLSNSNNFKTIETWISDYSEGQGWKVNKNPRFVADVNGDGKADIIGFGDNGTYVSLSN